jgi:hypothetical protein
MSTPRCKDCGKTRDERGQIRHTTSDYGAEWITCRNEKFHTNPGVAAPLEPSRQPKCFNCGCLLMVDGFTTGTEEGGDSKAANLQCGHRFCWHCSDNRGRHEEHECSEAIPLDDLELFTYQGYTSRQLAYRIRFNRTINVGKVLRDFAEAYAAAVSKNLQEELAGLVGMVNSSDAGHTITAKKLIAAETRILELEKEIAALRETK